MHCLLDKRIIDFLSNHLPSLVLDNNYPLNELLLYSKKEAVLYLRVLCVVLKIYASYTI